MTDCVISATDLTKVYKMGEVEVRALDGLSICVDRGEVVAIMGPSGSGKSTLMNILGCLDHPTDGEYILDNEVVSDLRDDQLSFDPESKGWFYLSEFQSIATDFGYCECGIAHALRWSGRRPKKTSTRIVGTGWIRRPNQS